MKNTNQEIDYVEAILAMRTILSLNNTRNRKSEMSNSIGVEVVDYYYQEKSMTKQARA